MGWYCHHHQPSSSSPYQVDTYSYETILLCIVPLDYFSLVPYNNKKIIIKEIKSTTIMTALRTYIEGYIPDTISNGIYVSCVLPPALPYT